MSKFLPTSKFKWIDREGFDLNKYKKTFSKGFVVEVDFEYRKGCVLEVGFEYLKE